MNSLNNSCNNNYAFYSQTMRTLTDAAKSTQGEIKILGLTIQQFLTTDPMNKAKLSHRIGYLVGKQNHLADVNQSAASILMRTINICHEDIFKNPQGYFNTIEKMKENIVYHFPKYKPYFNSSQSSDNSLSNPARGICLGISIDLMKNLLKIHPDASDFEEQLIECAKEYQEGGKLDAYANQIVYQQLNPSHDYEILFKILKKLKKSGSISSAQYKLIELTLLFKIFDPKKAGEICFLKEKIKLHPYGLEDLKKLIREINHEMEENVSQILVEFLKKPVMTSVINASAYKKMFESIIENKNISNRNAQKFIQTGEILDAFVELLSKKHGNMLNHKVDFSATPVLTSLAASSLLTKIIGFASHSFGSLFRKTPSLNLSTPSRPFSNLTRIQQSHISHSQRYNPITKLNHFKMKDRLEITGLPGAKTDAEYLNCLASLDPGVYLLNFKTGQAGHATVYVKGKDHSGYFFDPQAGLIKCDDSHKKTILRYLNYYPLPDAAKNEGSMKNKNNHEIHIRQAVAYSAIKN